MALTLKSEAGFAVKASASNTEIEEVRLYETADGQPRTALQFKAELDALNLKTGQPHSGNSDYTLIDVDAQPVNELAKVWRLRLRYATNVAGGGAGADPNPLNRPPEYHWSGGEELREFGRDLAGNPVVNSAEERFESLPLRETGELTLTVIRNVRNPDKTLWRQFMHVVNNKEFTIDGASIPTRFAKIHLAEAPKITENGVTFYQERWVIKFKGPTDENPDGGWNPVQIRDAGWNVQVVDGVTGELVWEPIHDSRGMEVRREWPLNGNGLAQELTDPPVYRSFTAYIEKDFAELDL